MRKKLQKRSENEGEKGYHSGVGPSWSPISTEEEVGQVVNCAIKIGFPAELFQKWKLAQKLSVTPYRRS